MCLDFVGFMALVWKIDGAGNTELASQLCWPKRPAAMLLHIMRIGYMEHHLNNVAQNDAELNPFAASIVLAWA
mgnify:CR=1 FL=1